MYKFGYDKSVRRMSQSMKTRKKFIKMIIWSETIVSRNQFRFMSGKSTIELIFYII